jgi:hypothetical protein
MEGVEKGEDWIGAVRVAAQGPFVVVGERLKLVRTREHHEWSSGGFDMVRALFLAETQRWTPASARSRLPFALRGQRAWRRSDRLLREGRRLAGIAALATAIAYDPGLLRARLLWRCAGPGMLKSLLPLSARRRLRQMRASITDRSTSSMSLR